MAALMRGLLSKFSQLNVGTQTLRPHGLNGGVSIISGLQDQTVLKCATRFIRSAASNHFTGTQLNATSNPSVRQEVVENPQVTDLAITKDVIAKVNHQIQQQSHGRLFAIIHMAGKQTRVTDGDLIMVEGTHPTNVGDIIRVEKVLLVGSKDFTLLGRPLLRPDMVRVEATVVEKSLTHTKTLFKKKRRKNYMRINFHRCHFTIFRINCVRLEGLVDQRPEIEGVDGRIF